MMTRKKIILIQPPLADGTKLLVEKKDMPFGLAYVARSLLKAGFEVEVFDIYGSLYYKNSPFFDRNKVIEKIRTLEADFFGIGALSTQYSYVNWLVSEIKQGKRKNSNDKEQALH
ncbi:MAG: hypothetical protein HY747_01540 [Elusimicrobia bacterium]|nr:hypothetical protein [Elusimicrobiota bacterium]